MSLQSIKYQRGSLEILDQLLLPVVSKYLPVRGVEDGWKVINKMQVSTNNHVVDPHSTEWNSCLRAQLLNYTQIAICPLYKYRN